MSGADEDVQRLEQFADRLQQLEAQRQSLSSEVEQLKAAQQDITEAIEALRSLESDSRVQVPVGGGAFVRATVEDIDEVIVRLGGGFAAERSREKAIETLTDRRELLGDQVDDLQSAIEDVDEDISEMEGRARELQAKVQQRYQQQVQQLRGQGAGPGVGDVNDGN